MNSWMGRWGDREAYSALAAPLPGWLGFGPCGKLDRRNRFRRPAPQAEELRGHFIAEPENRLKQNSLQNWTSRSTGSHVIAWLKYLIVKNCINISQRLPPSSPPICYGHNFRLKTPKARTFIHFIAMFFVGKMFSPGVLVPCV